MKTIEVKTGNKTTFKIVQDDYTPVDEGFEQKDLTTSTRKSIGFSDIPAEKWNNIFNTNERGKDVDRFCGYCACYFVYA